MFNAASMLSKARDNPIYGVIKNRRGYYRNVYLQSDHWKQLREKKLRSSVE